MHNQTAAAILTAVTLTLAACGDSGTTTTATAPSTQERIKQDLKAAGQNIKDTGDAIAQKADPALQKAKEESKDLVHRAAEKLSDMTAPAPPP